MRTYIRRPITIDLAARMAKALAGKGLQCEVGESYSTATLTFTYSRALLDTPRKTVTIRSTQEQLEVIIQLFPRFWGDSVI